MCAAGLSLAVVLAMTVFKMPVSMTLLSASQGLAFAVMPMIFIVVGAVWLYNLTEFLTAHRICVQFSPVSVRRTSVFRP